MRTLATLTTCSQCEQRCTLIMTALLFFYLPVRTVRCIYILDVWCHSSPRYTAAYGCRWLSPALRSQTVVYLRHDPCSPQGASHNTAIGCNTQLRHIRNTTRTTQLHSYVPVILLTSLKQPEGSVSIGAQSVSDFRGRQAQKSRLTKWSSYSLRGKNWYLSTISVDCVSGVRHLPRQWWLSGPGTCVVRSLVLWNDKGHSELVGHHVVIQLFTCHKTGLKAYMPLL
jgi:hypothetical protein